MFKKKNANTHIWALNDLVIIILLETQIIINETLTVMSKILISLQFNTLSILWEKKVLKTKLTKYC